MTNDKQKDRLVELLQEASTEAGKYFRETTKKVLAEKSRFNSATDIDRRNIYEVEADHLLANGVIVPPCKVGDKYYRIELWCTEGGYWEKPRKAYDSTCDSCCEECDGKKRVVEYTFNSVIQILEAEPYFHKYVFLTKEEAVAKLVTDTNVGCKKEEGAE